MIPYFICILPVIFLCLFSHNRYEGNTKAISLMLFPLFALIAFRGISVGTDTRSYVDMFIAMRDDLFLLEYSYERIEIGFKLLLKGISAINSNPQILFIVQALIFYFVFINFLKKNTVDPARFILLFLGLNLFNFYLTGIRQAIAMSICLLSYQMAKEQKPIRFLLLVGLAFSFHKSALFFLITYPLCRLKMNKNYIFLYVFAIGAVALLNERLFEIGGSVFDINYGIEAAQNGYIMVGIVAVITIMSFLYYESLVFRNSDSMILIQLNIVSMAMWVLRLYSRTAERVAIYFLPFTILLLIELLYLSKDKKYRQLLNLCTVLFFSVYFIYRLNGLGLVPYKFFWDTGGM